MGRRTAQAAEMRSVRRIHAACERNHTAFFLTDPRIRYHIILLKKMDRNLLHYVIHYMHMCH